VQRQTPEEDNSSRRGLHYFLYEADDWNSTAASRGYSIASIREYA